MRRIDPEAMEATTITNKDAIREHLINRFSEVRSFTEYLCEPLVAEDYVVQTMTDVSPTKWHLAHVSWFFETFVLREFDPTYVSINDRYAYLFNSYYVQAGERHCRDQRGYLSRPTVKEVYVYRAHVDEAMHRFLTGCTTDTFQRVADVLEVGLNHEQQHQELILTDIKHVLSVNPLRPVYRETTRETAPRVEAPIGWVEFAEGVREIGHDGEGFAYDNEGPRHRAFLEPFALADRLVTNGEYLQFMQDGGYERPELWLSAGWAWIAENGFTEPFYWERRDGGSWMHFTLSGMKEVNRAEPVCHLSYFEADAYARWADARLPEEREWEVAAEAVPVRGNLVDEGQFAPTGDAGGNGLRQMYGDVWEWTRSQYSPYPGYRPAEGAIGEYNGKFMCNQFVLRGGSCATSRSHIRRTYRNFFAPESCWQFTGLRLARDLR
jgi:ergothioneine biosynthesis protein EgtB